MILIMPTPLSIFTKEEQWSVHFLWSEDVSGTEDFQHSTIWEQRFTIMSICKWTEKFKSGDTGIMYEEGTRTQLMTTLSVYMTSLF